MLAREQQFITENFITKGGVSKNIVYKQLRDFIYCHESCTNDFLKKLIQSAKMMNNNYFLICSCVLKAETITNDVVKMFLDEILPYCIGDIYQQCYNGVYDKIVKTGYKFNHDDFINYLNIAKDNTAIETMMLLLRNTNTTITLDYLVKNADPENIGCWFPAFVFFVNNEEITVSTETGNYIIDNLKWDDVFNKSLMKWLIDRKFIPNDETLELTCKWLMPQSLCCLLENYKMKINTDHFNRLFFDNLKISLKDVKLVATVIDIMVKNGLELTATHVEMLAMFRYYVNNVDKYVKTDDEKKVLKVFCREFHMYKYHDLLEIDQKKAVLYELCSAFDSSLKQVKKIVKNGTEPDLESLKIACSNPNQKRVVEFLLDFVEPDNECLEKLRETYNKTDKIIKTVKTILNKK